MSEQYKLVFAHLDEDKTQVQATLALQQKLKLNDKQTQAFFDGQPIFPASDQNKALKQAKVLATLGIRSRLKRVTTGAAATAEHSSKRDEQILAALDYVTSSLIRIEERLDDMDHRFSERLHRDEDTGVIDDLGLDLSLGEDLDIDPISKPKRWPIVLLGVLIVLLLTILGLHYLYPDIIEL
ncbi:hypothetical protein [Pseudoalteromonas pernae]|uniref:hypothetical protein n=1 Tax=Pseudoalteromonas pernae TaxID=3118054 RepID=UPI003242FCA5